MAELNGEEIVFSPTVLDQEGYYNKEEVDTLFNDVNTSLDDKATKVTGATANNFASLDDDGDLADSGYSANEILGQILTVLDTANKNINTLSMLPSTNKVQTGTLTASTEITASKSGYLCVGTTAATPTNGYIAINNNTSNVHENKNIFEKNYPKLYAPVVAGDKIYISFTEGYSISYYIVPSKEI